MAVVKVYHEITVDGVTQTGGRLAATTLTVTKLAYSIIDASVAASSTAQLLWTTANGGITTFTQGYIISDQDIYIELRTDNVTAEFVLMLVKANTPFWFSGTAGGNTTESLDGATLVDGTDFDDVDRIEVQNEGTTAATVSLFLFN
jgi:hypothetical protein